VHAAFAEPGRVLAEAVELPDGGRFLTIARTLEGPQGGFDERPRRTALLIACDIAFKDETVYGAALPAGATASATPGKAAPGIRSGMIAVGPACRVCERAGCLSRAEPPVTRPLGLDEMVTGLSAFDFQ